jgi:hypothetical protein
MTDGPRGFAAFSWRNGRQSRPVISRQALTAPQRSSLLCSSLNFLLRTPWQPVSATTRAQPGVRTERAALLALAALLLAGCAAPAAEPPGPGSDGAATLPGLAWTARSPSPTPRTEVAVAELDGLVYVLGGFTLDGANVPLMEVYDPAADAWSRGPDYPIPVHHTGFVAHDGALMVLGAT